MTAGLNMAALLLVALALVAAGAIALDSWATRPPRGNRLSNGARESTFVSAGRCPPRPAVTTFSSLSSQAIGSGGERPDAGGPRAGRGQRAGTASPAVPAAAARSGPTREVPLGA